jgi:hypothetical protein
MTTTWQGDGKLPYRAAPLQARTLAELAERIEAGDAPREPLWVRTTLPPRPISPWITWPTVGQTGA